MSDWTVHRLRRGEVHVTRAERVYPTLEPGSVSLVISDGPYGVGKAAWDRQRGEDGLREWYRPHVEAWGRVCAPAASVYVWGTDDSASALRPLMREHGWTKRVRVTWDKGGTPANLGDVMWADVTEVCDVYQRGEAHEATVTRLDQRGRVRGCGNVWPYRLVGGSDALSAERLHTGRIVAGKSALHPDCLEVLHPCQKPLAFYDRIIRASSRPGDLVMEPFGGTLRAAVAIERLPEREARRYCCIEMDEDGRGYVPAVLATMGYAEAAVVEQVTLW